MNIIIRGRWKVVGEALLPEYSSNVTDSSYIEFSAQSVAVLQAVADPVRWAVLSMLADEPRCVCKLQEQIPIAGNLLSYHLKTLREAGLVTTNRRGRWIDYALAKDAPQRMCAALPGALVRASASP
jgi:ArsR family transcriptional regulator